MQTTQAAIYARGATDRQTEAHTIARQVEALRARVAGLPLSEAMAFLDDG